MSDMENLLVDASLAARQKPPHGHLDPVLRSSTSAETAASAAAQETPCVLPTKKQQKKRRVQSLRRASVSAESDGRLQEQQRPSQQPVISDEAAFINETSVSGAGASQKKYEAAASTLPSSPSEVAASKRAKLVGVPGATPTLEKPDSRVSRGFDQQRPAEAAATLSKRPSSVIRHELRQSHANEAYFEMSTAASTPAPSAAYQRLTVQSSSTAEGQTNGRGGGFLANSKKKLVHGLRRVRNAAAADGTMAEEGDEEDDGREASNEREEEQIVVSDRDVQRHAGRREFGFVMTPDKKNQLAMFVKTNINCLECTTYIPNNKKHAGQTGSPMAPCFCGRPYEWHRLKGCRSLQPGAAVEWSTASHTKEIKSTAFGQISFVGFPGGDRRYLAPYVRVNVKTPPSKVWELVSKHWDLPAPKLLLSITGGAKRFFTKNRETQIFKKELIDAVKATGAWVLTCGLGAGVMQYVGQAVHEYAATVGSMERHKLVLLGVCPWGAIDNLDVLVEEQEGNGKFPAYYDASLLHNKSGTAALDNNHTHFIFVDNGSVERFGGEIEWRADFEKYISMHIKTGIDKEQSIHAPVVQLLINGGLNSLQTAAEAIENGTPVIIVDGTKRAAELFATAYKLTANISWSDKRAVSALDAKLLPLMQRTIDTGDTKYLDMLRQVLQQRDLITIFTLDSLGGERTLDRIILQALMKANKADPKAQLSLALAWNKPDFARSEILTSESNYRVLSGEKLYDPLFRSMINDQHEFVQLFLDCGIDLHKFLTPARLRDMYKEMLNMKDQDSQSELIQILIDREHNANEKKDSVPLLEMVGRVIVMLIGSYYPNEYKYLLYDKPNDLKSTRRPENAAVNAKDIKKENNSQSKKELSVLKNPEKHLLLWALLFNRFELAIMFWKAGVNHMSMALISARISGKLSRIADAEDMDDLIVDFQRLTQTFEVYASEVLTNCYARNKQLTYVCLTRQVRDLGNATALSIAEDAEHEDFMQHMSCQLKLSRIWKGNMVVYTSEWKLVLTALLPFALVPWMYFVRKDSSQPRIDEREFDDLAQLQPVDSVAFVSSVGAGAAAGKDKAASPSSAENGASQFVESSLPFEEQQDRQQHGKYFSVSMTGSGANKIKYTTALWYFLTAPVTKFIYNVYSYLAFLIIFSMFVLTELAPVKDHTEIQVFEVLTWIWSVSLIMEEVRQLAGDLRVTRQRKVASRTGTSIQYKIERWWSNDWNKMDVVMYGLLIMAVVLRFHVSVEHFMYARMAYVVSLSFFIIRCTQMFFVYKQIGPKIIMIRRMLRDLFFFIFILSVFLFCFGISYRALLYPNAVLNGYLLANVIFHPYFIIFGQAPIDEVFFTSVDGCSVGNRSFTFGNDDACPTANWLAPIYLALYSLVANILLINLLIAMFSFTFQSVQEHSERLWKYNRYSLIYEFFDRPSLPCPFIVLSHAYRAVQALRWQCGTSIDETRHNDDFQITLGKEETQRVVAFERVAMESYLTRLSQEEKDNIGSKVQTTSQRMEKVLDDIDDIKDNLAHVLANTKDPRSYYDPPSYAQNSSAASLREVYNDQQSGSGNDLLNAAVPGQSQDTAPAVNPLAQGDSQAIDRMRKDVAALGQRLEGVESSVHAQLAALATQLAQQTNVVLQIAARLEAPTAGRTSAAVVGISSQLAHLSSSTAGMTPVDAGRKSDS